MLTVTQKLVLSAPITLVATRKIEEQTSPVDIPRMISARYVVKVH